MAIVAGIRRNYNTYRKIPLKQGLLLAHKNYVLSVHPIKIKLKDESIENSTNIYWDGTNWTMVDFNHGEKLEWIKWIKWIKSDSRIDLI